MVHISNTEHILPNQEENVNNLIQKLSPTNTHKKDNQPHCNQIHLNKNNQYVKKLKI